MLLALHPFVQCPWRLSLHIEAHGTPDPRTPGAVGQAIGHRMLESLSMNISGHSAPVLQSLCGVKAQSISIVASCVCSGDQIAEYHKALLDLVRTCGARELRLPQSHLDAPLCARLLALRTDWLTVEFSMKDSAGILEWLSAGPQTIGRLELNRLNDEDVAMAELLTLAAKNRVHTVVVHDTVGVLEMVSGLRHHLKTSMHIFERIEACLMTDGSELEDSTAFERDLFERLINSPMVLAVLHMPFVDLPEDRRISWVGIPLDGAHVERLHARNAQHIRMAGCQRRRAHGAGRIDVA